MERVYWDYAATTPVDPAVMDAMRPYFFERFGNPSSSHGFGQEAAAALESAREMMAALIGAKPDELILNSGTTEGCNHAISSLVESRMERGDHLLVSAVEHPCVLRAVGHLAQCGFHVETIPVDGLGRIDPEDVRRRITDQTLLLAVMHASNEIGTIQPITEIGVIARQRGVPFLVDACQTVGHVPIRVDDLNADVVTFSAHKFYGLKGVGGMYVRQGTALSPFLFGGDQERGRRASTQNVAGVVGMARAAELCGELMDEESRVQNFWRTRLIRGILDRIDGVKINGDQEARLPNNVHCSFEGIDGQQLLAALDTRGICASMGSACSAGAMTISHVLQAIGLPQEWARGSLRLTSGRWTTDSHVDSLLEILPEVVTRLRR